jgi:hypothetical protein
VVDWFEIGTLGEALMPVRRFSSVAEALAACRQDLSIVVFKAPWWAYGWEMELEFRIVTRRGPEIVLERQYAPGKYIVLDA